MINNLWILRIFYFGTSGQMQLICLYLKIFINYYQHIGFLGNANMIHKSEILQGFENILQFFYVNEQQFDCHYRLIESGLPLPYLELLFGLSKPLVVIICVLLLDLFLHRNRRSRLFLIVFLYFYFAPMLIKLLVSKIFCRHILDKWYVQTYLEQECFDMYYFLFLFLLIIPGLAILIVAVPYKLFRNMQDRNDRQHR